MFPNLRELIRHTAERPDAPAKVVKPLTQRRQPAPKPVKPSQTRRKSKSAIERAKAAASASRKEQRNGHSTEVRTTQHHGKFSVRKSVNSGGRTIGGYFSTFSPTRSENMGGWYETIKPGAFAKSLRQNDDILCLLDHEHSIGKLLARTSNGSLSLSEDATGLRFSASLIDNETTSTLVSQLEAGLVTQCSIGFYVPEGGDDWEQLPDGVVLRTISEAYLIEGSLVTQGAYKDPHVSLTRGKVTKKEQKRQADEDCDPELDDDCEDEERSCDCDCTECVAGDCNGCTNSDCDSDDCLECGMQQRSAHLALLTRRLLS
jgi:HK97 family phage prohead protease